MNYLKTAVFIGLASLCFAFQEPEPQEGQPATCNNYKNTVHKCMCDRAMMCGRGGTGSVEPDSKCLTTCRPKACLCLGPCTSRH